MYLYSVSTIFTHYILYVCFFSFFHWNFLFPWAGLYWPSTTSTSSSGISALLHPQSFFLFHCDCSSCFNSDWDRLLPSHSSHPSTLLFWVEVKTPHLNLNKALCQVPLITVLPVLSPLHTLTISLRFNLISPNRVTVFVEFLSVCKRSSGLICTVHLHASRLTGYVRLPARMNEHASMVPCDELVFHCSPSVNSPALCSVFLKLALDPLWLWPG